jgi:hypothetical protein
MPHPRYRDQVGHNGFVTKAQRSGDGALGSFISRSLRKDSSMKRDYAGGISTEEQPVSSELEDLHIDLISDGDRGQMMSIDAEEVEIPIPPIPVPRPKFPISIKALLRGCYLLRYTPGKSSPGAIFPLVHYDGTLRIQTIGGFHASGDLYQHSVFPVPFPGPRFKEPNPAAGIPIFSRSRYRYYLRVTSSAWLTLGTWITIKFERHRFDQVTRSWTNEGTFTARMTWTTAPPGYPVASQYLTGPVLGPTNFQVGHLTMGWVSASLRKATVEIDRVNVSEAPLQNAGGSETWGSVFAKSQWQVTALESDTSLSERSGESWSDPELHDQLLASRDQSNLDIEWRYVILAVRRLDSTTRGIMFDAFATDSNKVPREGAAISSHWTIPNDPAWGTSAGLRFGTATDAYFRTAVHELGHALNLIHEENESISGTTFMTTTPTVVGNATPANPFPTNITWDFHPTNKHRIRHWPDIYVRPGGVPFAEAHGTTPIAPDDMRVEADGMSVHVQPVQELIPIGAPVRFDVELRNDGDRPVFLPPSIGYKKGHIRGYVTAPGGAPREFRSIIRCFEDEELVPLEAGDARVASVTLMRGPEGALFATPGLHKIDVVVEWSNEDGAPLMSTGVATIYVEDAKSPAHAAAAAAVLSQPDLAVVVALGGGDHLTEGLEALDRALATDELRPHYAVTEAMRVGRSFFDRDADDGKMLELLSKNVVVATSEVRTASRMIATKKSKAATKDVVSSLKSASKRSPARRELAKLLDAI